eukprot:gene16445-11759_t
MGTTTEEKGSSSSDRRRDSTTDSKAHKSKSHKHAKDRRDSHSKKKKSKKDKKDKKHSSDRKHSRHEKKKSHKRSRDDDSDSSSSSESDDSDDSVAKEPKKRVVALCSTIADPITEEDYFAKSQEFRIWLRQYHHPSFEALSSKEAHHIFVDLFLPAYNAGSLPPYFYTGDFPAEMKHTALHTQHKWNLRLNPSEKDQLQTMLHNIEESTNHPVNK